MSTVTKIKGTFNNPNLPILTDEGLVNYYYGLYINNLAECEFELSASQKAAVKAFVDYLADNELIGYIQLMFPFIGSSTNVLAANVPVIGNVKLGFASDFNKIALNGTDIVGVTQIPSMSTITLEDAQPVGNLYGAAISINKNANVTAQYKVISFNNKYQIRVSDNKITFYGYFSDSESYTVHALNNGLSNISDAGSVYYLGIYQNGKYVRYAEKASEVSQAVGTTPVRPAIQAADVASPVTTADNFSTSSILTSLTFFNTLLSKEQATLYMHGLKTFMTALGRNV